MTCALLPELGNVPVNALPADIIPPPVSPPLPKYPVSPITHAVNPNVVKPVCAVTGNAAAV